MKRTYSKLSVFLLIFVLASGTLRAGDQDDYYTGLKKGWQYMQMVYERLNQQYVDDLNPYPLIRAGINGMLSELDPYTVFLEEDGQRRLRIMTTGKYGGLGMEIGLRNKKITVIAPISNSPAKKIGIQAGDIIDKIDGKITAGKSVDQVSKELRGEIGTDVTLTILRPGLNEPMDLTITRAQIVLEDVGYSGFIAPGTAYLNLNSFTDKAVGEVVKVIQSLQKEQEIKAFILDLRGNPGGLLDAAVNIVNLFVPKDQLVVFTKGFREKEYKFFTSQEPLLPDVPLAVLVDGGSASASEIVAGALQDLDRAVIVGEDTFGKGLVQKVFTLDKHRNVKLKMTTAKYYIPSGRCIQKKDYGRNNEVIARDSLQKGDNGVHKFYTQHKREVFDKGGIYPDVNVSSDTLSFVLMQLIRKSMIFDFAVDYHNRYPGWKENPVFADSIMEKFKEFLSTKNFKYECACNKDLERIKKYIQKKKYTTHIQNLLNKLEQSLNAELNKEFDQDNEQIAEFLYLDMIEKYFNRKERDRISLQKDKQALKAIDVVRNIGEYQRILALK